MHLDHALKLYHWILNSDIVDSKKDDEIVDNEMTIHSYLNLCCSRVHNDVSHHCKGMIDNLVAYLSFAYSNEDCIPVDS